MDSNLLTQLTAFVDSFAKQKGLPALRERLERDYPNDLYRQMIIFQRCRHNTTNEEPWEGRDEYAPAETWYPNILAEFDASGYWMDRVADFAGVSYAVMASVIESNGDLSLMELKGLTRCFGCGFGYLASPVLSIVDPSTNKGKARSRYLRDLLDRTQGRDFVHRFTAEKTLALLERGNRITYASYRVACRDAQYVCESIERERMKKQRTRSGPPPERIAGVDLSPRLKLVRERAQVRNENIRLLEIRKAVAGVHGGPDVFPDEDLKAISALAKRDMCGAIILAFLYGRKTARSGKGKICA